jgi:peptide/nickel transport system substrate-binding protein
MDDPRARQLLHDFVAGRLDRRQLVKRALVLGLTAPAVALLLGETARDTVAAPASIRAMPSSQVDAKTLVIADNMSSGGLWLSLDPGRIYEINPGSLMNVVYEPLYHLPDSSKPDKFEALLASGMPQVSPDGKEVTVKLRQGVKFHTTGNDMTAVDWVYSLNRTRSLKDNPSYLAEYWDNVEAVDPLTLKFTLSAPQPALVAILTSAPLSVVDSKTVMAHGGTGVAAPAEGETATPGAGEADSATEWLNANSAGTGPYKVTQWDPNSEIIIERNPDYWGDAPAFDRIIWRDVVSANEQLQAVQAGEADIAYSLDPDAVDQVKSDPNLQLLTGETISLEYLALNTQEDPGGPLAKKEVRQAIASAIDYDGIISSLLTGAGVRPATIVPLPMPGSEAVKAQSYQNDPAHAQELFDASGVGEAEITFSFQAGGESQGSINEETLATKIQSDLQRVKGLTIKLNPMDANTWIADYRAGKLQFTLAPWGPDFPDIQSYTEPFGRSEAGVAKRVGYSNPAVDKLLDQIIAEPDPAKKQQLYVEVQKTLIDDAPFIVLYQPIVRRPARKNVTGVTNHFLYGIQLRYAAKTE